MSQHCKANEDKIQTLIDTGIVPCLINAIKDIDSHLVFPCIIILGNISTGTQHQISSILAALDSLEKLLEHKTKTVRREVCWIIANIAASNQSHVATLLARENMIMSLLRLFETDEEDIQR
jgi:uncharacterized protein YgbK (DUF1537 family)